MTKSEEEIKTALEERGFHVHRNGWPDFLVTRENLNGNTYAFACEVKSEGDKVKPHQRAVHQVLQMAGLPCYTARRPEDIVTKRGRECINEPIKHMLQRKIWGIKCNDIYSVRSQIAEMEAKIQELQQLLDDCTILFKEEKK